MHDRLKQCRLQHDFSQKYVAMTIGVSKPTVSQWENGVKRPSIENLISLAALYETTVDYLVGNTDDVDSIRPQRELITAQERQLLALFRSFPENKRASVLQFLETMSESPRPGKNTNLPVVENRKEG